MSPETTIGINKNIASAPFLSTGFGFYCFIIFQANCWPGVLYRPRDYAGTGMQKAWPYGRCLIAILKEERRRNGPQGHSLTPATMRHERDSNYTHPAQQPTVAFEPYDCKLSPYVVRRKKTKQKNVCYVYENGAAAYFCFFTLTIKSVFLHDMCKVSSWSKEAVIPYPVSTS